MHLAGRFFMTPGVARGPPERGMDLDLSQLTLAEKEAILRVIKRDEALRKMEERRILHLKAELQRLRKRGALRPGLDPARSCARCLAALGRILNRGAPCPACRKKVCRDCRLFEPGAAEGSDQWLCVVCHKQMELKATSGQWMQDLCRRSSRRRKLNGPPVTDLLGRALECSRDCQPSQERGSPGRARDAPDSYYPRPPAPFGATAAASSSHPDSPQSLLTAQDSLSSEVADSADDSASCSASKPTAASERTSASSTPPTAHLSPTGARWAPLRGPLRAPLRKLPRQGSLSSSSDSLSAEPRTKEALEESPPVPFPRTKRQSPQRQAKVQEKSAECEPQHQRLPEPKAPVAASLSAPASPAFRARARSALTVTYSSPPCVQDGPPRASMNGGERPAPVRKATAPELTGLERAKEVAFRRVTLSKVRMDSNDGDVMDRAACESLPCTPTDPDDSPPFPILPPPLVFDDFLFSRDAHGDPNHATLTGEPLSVPTNAPSPPCSPLARRLDQLRRRSFRIRDLLKNSDSELPSRPASQNSYDSRLWQFEDSDCEVKLKDRSPDDYKLVFISSDSSEEDSEAEASRVWLLLRSRLALGPEGSVYVEDTSDWEFASDEDDWALSCSSDGGSDSYVAGGGAPCCAAEERQGVGAGPQVVDPEQRSPEEARGEKGLGERGAAGRMGGRVGPEGTPSDDDDQDPTCFSAVVAILAEQRVPDNRRDESLPANLHAVRGGGTAGVGEPGQEVCPAAGLAAAPPVVDSAAPEAGEGSGADDDAIAGRPRDSLARDDAIMVDRVPLTLARGPEPIAAGPSADGCPREEAPRQRASEEQQPAADNAPETAIANMADALRDTGQGVREVGQLEESGAPAAANPQMSSAAAGTEGVATAAVDIAVDADAATDPEPAAARECVVHQQVAAVCVSDCEAGVDLDAEDATQATCAPATTADSASESTVGEFAPGGSKSNDSVSVVVDAVVSAAVTDSVLDSVLDTPVMREKCVDLEGLVVSTLEKYFTESFECHDSGSDVHRDAPSIRDSEIRAVPSAPSATPPASSETAPRSNEASDASCDEEEEEEGMFSDASTSSDDAMYISPMPRLNPAQYGNPLSYSLHTILEESCEESERSSRATTPITKNPSSELEKYFSFAIGNASLEEIHKRWSVATSEEFSDSVSETSGVDDIEVMDEDPAVLASSRLEKYFTSGLLGNGLFHYPDDAEYTDESGGVSSEDEGKKSEAKEEVTEDSLRSAFEVEGSYNTIKRKKENDVGSGDVPATEVVDLGAVKKDEDATKRENADTKSNEPTNITMKKEADGLDVTSVADDDSLLDQSDSTVNHSDFMEEKPFEASSTNISLPLAELDNLETSISPIMRDVQVERQPSLMDSAGELTSGIESMCNSSNSEATFKPHNFLMGKISVATDEDVVSIHSRSSSTDGYSDEEAAYIVNRVIAHISGTSDEAEKMDENITPWKALLESQITRLMQTVSPAALSGESSCSSTIGSNNSDYGSDTLESGTYSSTDEEGSPKLRHHKKTVTRGSGKQPASNEEAERHLADNISGHSTDSTISEETMFICRQLMQSLKMLSDEHAGLDQKKASPIISDHNHNDYMKAQEYIQDQIVALMHTVNASRNGSPLRERRNKPLGVTGGSSECSDVDSPNLSEKKKKMGKNKTPSESGSETISTSISIPSYDSDHTATESEMSNEMDELYNLLESSGAAPADNISLSKLSCCDGEEPSDHFILSPFQVPGLRLHSGQEVSLIPACDPAVSKLEFLEPSCDLPQLSTVTVEEKLELPGMYSMASGGAGKCDSSSTLTTGSDLDFCGSVETVLEVCPKAGGISPEPSVSPTGTSADKSRSESSLYIKARKGLSQRKLVVTRSSDSLAPYKKASGESRLALQLFRSRGTSKSEHSIPDTTTSEDKEDVSDANRAADGLAKRIGSKEKSSSENNLSLATFPDTERTTSKFLGTKSVGNITDLEGNPGKSSCFRDTGYYSFKSSEESVLSLDDPGSRPPSGSLTKQKSLQSSETIPEVEEEPVRPARTSGPASAKTNSLSSGSIPDSVFAVNSDCKSSTLPSNLRSKVVRPTPHSSSMVLRQRHFSSTFFSTSGVLRKLTALKADESSGSHRSSPRNRLRGRNRHSSGGSDDSNRLLPTISIVGADETSSMKSSADSTDRDSSHRDEELERLYTSCSRSQTSLSSIGVRSESMTSVYSAAGGGRYGTVAVTGEALFAIVYNYKSGLLEVHVKECRNLAPVDTKRNRSDPYVKVYLLPDKTKSGKRKTKVKKHTLNPVFEEVLKFRVTMSELQARTLWLSVWHSDMFGRNDFLGEVMLPLTYDTLEKTDVKCYSLQERFESPETPLSYKGDLVLALKYMPPDVTHRTSRQGPIRGSLHVLVKEARNLMATRSNGTSDPFCKSYLLPDRTKGSKQKTPVVKKSCNPKWNHTFVYPDVSLEELKDRCLELTVWDYDKITSNDFLGGVRLGLGTGKLYGRDVDWMDSQGEELTLWRSMLERPNLWIDGSLLLRPTLQSKR
ncbi:uncharacterized protein LOC8038847 isoform X3 [Ixodes scapularis]|uniref:uncharacterized protein LOC8038847 isoform X3 n=1 Tax=Ixodes scapularis TaxID=6945 RepID=UPI001C38F342|nr:uncharacterized protein LOC8038847 isoform X3 [Ixodes scapularis]